MIGDSLHVEMIKRCHEIIKFLCKYEEIMTPDLKDFVYICDNSYTK